MDLDESRLDELKPGEEPCELVAGTQRLRCRDALVVGALRGGLPFADVESGMGDHQVAARRDGVHQRRPAERRQANNQAALVIAAVTMPAAELKLPPEAQQYLNGLYATIGLALIVTWRINDNRKH